MGVTPINVARVSQNLRTFNLLSTIRSNQLGLFRTQNQLATGLRFSTPSEDPTRAAAAVRLDRQMDILRQVERNLGTTNSVLQSSEAATQEASDLIMEAHVLAVQTASDTTSPDQRESLRVVVDALIDQTIAVANRRHLDTFMFSGHFGGDLPFELVEDGVLFRGDDGQLRTIVDSDLSEDTFTISGMEFFNAVSQGVRGVTDLDPALTSETRLCDLNGATGSGVSTGRIAISDGSQSVEIDLSNADTVGDVVDQLNDELPTTLTATLSTKAINISPVLAVPGNITVTDVAGGNTAIELGIYAGTAMASVFGKDLDPRLTSRSSLSGLNDGAGIDLSSDLTIRVGHEVANVNFNQTETIEDVLNRINQASPALLAQLGEDGKSIEVRSRLSGADLQIGENGGNTATALGIRSMYSGTLLSELNNGLGIDSVLGDDIRITTADGTTVDIDVNDLDLTTATLADVIDLFNARGAGAITVALATQDNGLTITDNTAGGGTLQIERLNVSPAIDGLGFNVTATGNTLIGGDVNPVRVDSPFTSLLELREALTSDDAQAISGAGEGLLSGLRHMQEVQGELAAKAAAMLERADRIDSEVSATRVLQSDVRDVDMAEAIVRFQQMQIALQANLATASQVMNLSLLDYLR